LATGFALGAFADGFATDEGFDFPFAGGFAEDFDLELFLEVAKAETQTLPRPIAAEVARHRNQSDSRHGSRGLPERLVR